MSSPQIENPEQWVDEHSDALYAFALSRLNNPSSAEDVVQETFLAALKAQDKFTGESSARTWLIGILKHKIIDLIRKETREQPMDEVDALETPEERFFDKKGHWRVAPLDWQVNPGEVLEQKEFMDVLGSCLKNLPDRLRRLFVLRELEDQTSEEICKDLEISSTNLWVMLYRARMRLRGCINENWLGKLEEASS